METKLQAVHRKEPESLMSCFFAKQQLLYVTPVKQQIMHCPGLIAANWHTNTGVDVQLSNGVSCVSYVSSYVHRCAIGFPSWISSVLVAEKCLYVK